jgi:hypothetical protein
LIGNGCVVSSHDRQEDEIKLFALESVDRADAQALIT